MCKGTDNLSLSILIVFVALFVGNAVLFAVDFPAFEGIATFGWKTTHRFNIYNSVFLGYCGLVLVLAAKWPNACALFRYLVGGGAVNRAKRRRSLVAGGVFFVVMALI